MKNFLYPALFVGLWSTGFVGAKFGLPYAEPLSFLLLRYVCVVSLMLLLALLARAAWPRDWRTWLHLGVAGILIHAIYLSGVFMAINQGLPAGIVSLVVGLQPLLTAMVAGLLLGESVRQRQWLGLILGLAGTVIVLSGRLRAGFDLAGLWPALAALLGLSSGALYQKRFCPHFDWRSGAVIQFMAAALVTLPFACVYENFEVQWTADFVFALGWLVLVLSLGAVTLLNHLIRSGTAVNVASLFYLVPPMTALVAWFVFDEIFSITMLVGLLIAVVGVSLARK